MPVEKTAANMVLVRRLLSDAAALPFPFEALAAVGNQLRQPQLLGNAALALSDPRSPYEVVSARDQLQLALTTYQLTLEDVSPAEPFSPRFWEVLSGTINATGWQTFSYAINLRGVHRGFRPAQQVAKSTFNLDAMDLRLAAPTTMRSTSLSIPVRTSAGNPLDWLITIEPAGTDSPSPVEMFVSANIALAGPVVESIVRPESTFMWHQFTRLCSALFDY